MGNSEVGHTNLGAGRVVYQDLTRIDKSIRDGTICETRPALLAAYDRCAGASTHALHLIGLLSDGGVHSHQAHLHALHRAGQGDAACRACSCTSSPTAATRRRHGGRGYVAALEAAIAASRRRPHRRRSRAATARWIATSGGSATKLAYDAIVHGEGAVGDVGAAR